jgi:transaldolase
VSVELHPAIGYDIEKTLRYAQRYYAINPERFNDKIPMTPEGYCAVARSRDCGIPINYTLGFSARQNYLAALLAKPNYCNVFLGRLNAVVADNHLGDGKYVGERVTLASQAAVKQLRQSDSTIPTHQIAASMRSAEQMVSLAGVDVYTIPPKAVEEFYKHGYTTNDITDRTSENYNVNFAPETDKSSVEVLWTIDDNFKKFAASLAARGGSNLNGDDLREADRDFGTKLFSGFTPEEQTEIRTKGKIPDAKRWLGRAALDDLMTESALQSFIIDQGALDGRIRSLIG